MYHPFMVGDQIYLRGLERKDIDYNGKYFQWTNDSDVTHFLSQGAKPNMLEKLLEEYDKLVHSDKDIVFIVADKKNDASIGTAGLYGIHSLHRRAEFRILLGEKNYWNQGIGTEVTKLLVQYAFDKLNLNKVYLGVNVENVGAVRSYEKTGFVHEGTLREEVYRNGRYYDVHKMSVLRSEWLKIRSKAEQVRITSSTKNLRSKTKKRK